MRTDTLPPTRTETLTETQIHLVQSTWRSLEPAGTQVGQLFYQRLFELDPSLRALFGPDLRQQGDKLVAMIGVILLSRKELK